MPSAVEQSREIALAPGVDLAGDLRAPPAVDGLVVFAHGSGSRRRSPRNRQVAERLNEAGLATLLFDLLTEREERDRRNVFDIRLLADRLVTATRWASGQEGLGDLPVGYFGASTGAASHLFEEPGALENVAELAAAWFSRHLDGALRR